MAPRLAPGVFCGTRSRVREIGAFTLTEYEFGPRRDSPRHSHEQTYFSLVLDGCWREAYGRKVRDRKPFSLTIHPAGEVHSQELASDGARAFQVECAPNWLARLDGCSEVLAQSRQVESGPAAWQALRLYAEFQQIDPYSLLTIEGIVLEIIAELARNPKRFLQRRAAPWLVRVLEILHARFKEPLSVDSIAQEVNIHPVHLSRTFRSRYNCSPGEYVRQLRLQQACRDLIETDRPLAEVALAAGFVDQSHLSRLVRRFTGYTPAALRRRFR